MVRPDHCHIVGMNQVLHEIRELLDFLRPVAKHCHDFTIAENIAALDQIVNVENSRRSGRDSLHEVAATVQLELGPLTIRNVARNRLEAGYLPCLKNQLDVLADPTLAPISVDNRALIVSIFLLTPQLPQVESCGCMALVRADQLQVGTADHLGLAEAER